MYELVLSRDAQRFYEKCVKAEAAKLARCFATLEAAPRRGNNVKPLKGQFQTLTDIAPVTCGSFTQFRV